MTPETNRQRPTRSRSDLPFYLGFGLLGGLYVALILLMLAADLNYTAARDIVAAIYDGLEAGAHEVLADDTSRWVKQQLSQPLTALYPQLAAGK